MSLSELKSEVSFVRATIALLDCEYQQSYGSKAHQIDLELCRLVDSEDRLQDEIDSIEIRREQEEIERLADLRR